MATALSEPEVASWANQGYVVVRSLVEPNACEIQYSEAVAIARAHADDRPPPDTRIIPEGRPLPGATRPEDLVAKIFRLHRRDPFRGFVKHPDVLAALSQLIGPDIDVFLSQFIFKSPGSYGQPWHQDSFYFPFSESHQVGVWLAVTRATVQNGCLWVVPGSHLESVREHLPDDRPNATHAYTRIPDVDEDAAVPVEMSPGDVLFFDSHLMHSSTDNQSDELRAAFVCHYGRSGTRDETPPERSVNDWWPVLRNGAAVED